MAGSLLRVVMVYQHFFALGMQVDDPSLADLAARELARLDARYTPTFLLVAAVVSLAVAAVFARRRPKPAADLPLPLPAERRVETR